MEDADPLQSPHLGITGYYVDAAPGQPATNRFAKIHERYSWPIGTPTQTHKCASIDPSGGTWAPGWNCTAALNAYQVRGHSSYLRTFSNGVVLVNPSNASDTNVPLGGKKYTDPTTKQQVAAVTLPARTGKLLLSHL